MPVTCPTCRPVPLLTSSAQTALTNIDEFEPQHISNLLWGFAKLNFKPPKPLLTAAALRCLSHVNLFKGQELANLAFAFASLGHHPVELFDSLATEVHVRAFEFKPMELSQLMWAFGK